jgi:hypothetical protein
VDPEIEFTPDDPELGFVPDEEEAPAPTPAPKASAEQQDAAWADGLSALERARITARGLLPGAEESHRAQALMLLRRHHDTAMGQETTATPIYGRDERPTAGTTGLAQGATLGWADELGGAVSAARGGSYSQERDRLRGQATRAREQAPGLSGLGELAGTAPYALIPGAGSTGLARVGVQAGIGAGIGTASGAGFSEGETALDVATDAAMGGAVGGALGAGGQTLAEGARAGMGQLARVASGADRARVASVATGTSRELGDTLMREAESMPGGISGVAARLRRLDVVPAAGTAQDVSQGAERALGEVGYSGRLGQILEHLEQGAPVERDRLLGALDRYAGSVEGDPVLRRFGAAVRRRAEDFAETLPDTIGYRRATEILRGLGDQTTWVDPQTGARPPQDVARGTYRALRGELDDVAEEALSRSPEPSGGYRDAWQAPTGETVSGQPPVSPLEEFRGARLDTQAALFARDWSQRAMDRLARNRGISPTDYAAMMAGAGGNQSIGGAVVGGLMNRTWRLREGALRATGAEAAERLIRAHPERIGRWAGPLLRALEQGGSAFAAAHMALSSRDPEYRRAVEQASDETFGDEQEQE